MALRHPPVVFWRVAGVLEARMKAPMTGNFPRYRVRWWGIFGPRKIATF